MRIRLQATATRSSIRPASVSLLTPCPLGSAAARGRRRGPKGRVISALEGRAPRVTPISLARKSGPVRGVPLGSSGPSLPRGLKGASLGTRRVRTPLS